MSVKKIFMTLIIVVACVMVGAFLLNVLLPNATIQLVSQVENQIYRATGLKFDFNGDGVKGSDSNDSTTGGVQQYQSGDNDSGGGGAEVDGFDK